MKRFKYHILLYSKGLIVGIGNIVPGISSGTLFFITGVYTNLLHSIRAFDSDTAILLSKFRMNSFWKKINGNFLTLLIAGIVTAFFLLVKWVDYLFQHYPILIWSFCCGLISISSILMFRGIKKWHTRIFLFFIAGIVLTYAASTIPPFKSPDNYLLIFSAGFLAACGLILPGLSSTFILILIGKYQYLANARINFNFTIILVFILGGLAGLLSGSRLLTWALDNYNDVTIALFSGLMLGSLNKIWPWREVLEYVTDNKGGQVVVFDKSVLPSNYLALTGKDPLIFQAIFMMALGVFLIVFLEKVAERIKTI